MARDAKPEIMHSTQDILQQWLAEVRVTYNGRPVQFKGEGSICNPYPHPRRGEWSGFGPMQEQTSRRPQRPSEGRKKRGNAHKEADYVPGYIGEKGKEKQPSGKQEKT